MNNYCKDIESRIVDYFEGLSGKDERELLLNHISECADCRRKYEEFVSSGEIINAIKSQDLSYDYKEGLYERFIKTFEKRRVFFRVGLATAVVIILIFATSLFSAISHKNRLREVRDMEVTIEYFVDIEEGLIAADDETFEKLSAILYSEDYKEFEEILEETSFIKP